MVQPGQWTVRLTSLAKADFRHIVAWTQRHFGEAQARRYAATLSDAILALKDGPTITTARPREDIGKGILTLHVARGGHKGRHMLIFRISHEHDTVIDVLRILHESMDLPNHQVDEPTSWYRK